MPEALAIPFAFGVGAVAVGASGYAAYQQGQAQKRALRATEEATRLAQSRASAEQRRAEREAAQLARRKPDVAGLLGAEQRAALSGAGATSLTGAAGISSDRLTLARSSALGA